MDQARRALALALRAPYVAVSTFI
ncbi:MAG: hypothetical protein OSP8Acid_14740 [uncultured Acidilobus sp. OSP8]|nr:MAG: hypothetical protein OSP8Acid_14740 [uncultured Acidilobus sp. OSP8]